MCRCTFALYLESVSRKLAVGHEYGPHDCIDCEHYLRLHLLEAFNYSLRTEISCGAYPDRTDCSSGKTRDNIFLQQ